MYVSWESHKKRKNNINPLAKATVESHTALAGLKESRVHSEQINFYTTGYVYIFRKKKNYVDSDYLTVLKKDIKEIEEKKKDRR